MARADPLPSRRTRISLIRLVLASVLLTTAVWLSPVAGLERGFGLPFLYALRGVAPAPQDIVIVALDFASAQALGVPDRPDRWPRSLHARLVSGLAASGVEVIGFDVLFAQAREPTDDTALADALRRAGNVVLAESIRRDFIRAEDGSIVASTDRRGLPMPLLAEAASATAPFVLPKTADGVFEFWTSVPTVGDRPSLPMVMADRMRQPGPVRASASPERSAVRLLAPLAADESSRRILNLYGPLGTITTIPYATALELLADPAASRAMFSGKAVLVGYSESNQSRQVDAHRTPFSTADGLDVSGVELCATALGNLLQGSSLQRPGDGLVLALLGVHAGLLALPWGLVRARRALLITLGLGVAYATAAHLAFSSFLWLPVVVPLAFSTVIAATLGIVSHYRDSLRRRVELERAVELGVPRRAIEKLAAVLGDAGDGRTVLAVCLCSDIEAYATLSESLSPAAARDVLNRYFARFLPIIERHGGYAADMVGDSVMSLWIADVQPETAFSEACRAALELDQAMNGQAGDDGALPTRLGLHCGPIFFGKVGTNERRELRAVGDIINTTSRIEGANKYLKTRVIASRDVAVRVEAGTQRYLGHFRVAGKAQVLELLQLCREALPDAALRHFSAGLKAFEGGDFGAATAHFAAARAAGDTGPSEFYLEQCRQLAGRPRDPGWCGAVALPGK